MISVMGTRTQSLTSQLSCLSSFPTELTRMDGSRYSSCLSGLAILHSPIDGLAHSTLTPILHRHSAH